MRKNGEKKINRTNEKKKKKKRKNKGKILRNKCSKMGRVCH